MKFIVNGEEVELDLSADSVKVFEMTDRLGVRTPAGLKTAAAVQIGGTTLVSFGGRQFRIEKPTRAKSHHGHAAAGEAFAPMPGAIVEVNVQIGETVQKGQSLLVLEAMKTQQQINAPFAGTVAALPVEQGQQVVEGSLLVRIEPLPEPEGK